MSRAVTVVGTGRAGSSFADALTSAGWPVRRVAGRDLGAVEQAAGGADLVLVCVADTAVADVSARIAPAGNTVVAHVAGALGLDVLAPHPRRGSLHPLVSMPDAERGARRLRRAWFAVAGDPVVHEVVDVLDGRRFAVPDGERVRYHAAACVASNHLVALMGQVERLCAAVGVPVDAMWELACGSLDNVVEVGAVAALTGPAARGDRATVASHVEAIGADEAELYTVLSDAARRLATHDATATPERGGDRAC
ncbi:MAG: Rossmann-like and DUF2520 domain-containing protein [Microthrixaceae bacterium]